ncbi:MAG TPA: M48 family metallopeptidase, partial [Pirellulales bacterium]
MNFFEQQDAARKSTGRLVVLFGLAVAGIMLSVYLVFAIAFAFAENRDGQPFTAQDFFHPGLIVAVAIGVTLVVGGGTAYKVAQLAAGGQVVALELGGRRLAPDTRDPTERKILNIVEEMSIASGVPVPPVFMMDEEDGINAFAAGYSPNDAVVAVTRGCVEKLSRDELQGVVAHEFSHILNGDMRLNVRLIGVLNGVLLIGLIGYWVFRIALSSGGGRSRERDNSPLAFLAIGLALIVVGSIGTFFGNLIKAAVSRQREYLADASAVQFTRNPDGIAGALKKIGGYHGGSKIKSPNAPEASHMYFAAGLNSWFATHPPLADRIRRIDPNFNGQMTSDGTGFVNEATAGFQGGMGRRADETRRREAAAAVAAASGAAQAAGALPPIALDHAVAQIGRPTDEHVEYAKRIIERIPEPLLTAAHDAYAARMVIYSLLVGREPAIRDAQLAILARDADPAVERTTRQLLSIADELPRELRLPVVDVAIGSLTALSVRQFDAFKTTVDALIDADSRLTVFEWMVRKLLVKRLEPHFRPAPPPALVTLPLPQLVQDCSVLLSLLAHASGGSAEASFQAGASRLPNPRPQRL